MTIANQTNRTSAVGSGATGQAVPFSFPISATSDLTVIKRITATGVSTDLAETTNYTISITGDTGGTLTTVTTIETTETIHIIRNTPLTQSLDLEQGGSFNAENIEDALDKNTKLSIENSDALERTLVFPATDPTSSFANMPNSVDRASKNLTFDSDGKPTASVSIEEGSVTHTDFGKTIAEAADADTVRDLLELADGTVNLDIADIITKGPRVDVRAYGAVGNGATDDGPAVASAISTMSDGDVLVFPKGNFLLTTYSVQTITANITIVGADSKNTTITGPDTSTNFIELGASGNIILKNIGFSTFDEVIHGTTNNVDYIEIDGCKVDGAKHLYSDVGFATTGDVDSFRVNNSSFSNMTDTVIHLQSPVTKFVFITNNEFTDISCYSVVQLGDNKFAMSNNCYVVTGNYFKNITGTGNVHTILCYGKSAVIANNVINTVTSSGGVATGIYTKCINSIIEGNALYDACSSGGQGSIVAKGRGRGDVDDVPYGYGIIIANNNIYYSTAYTNDGILCSVSEGLITGNTIENAKTAIRFVGEDGPIISSNFIYNCSTGIYLWVEIGSSITGASITDNVFRKMNDSAETDGYGIRIWAFEGAISNVVISNNIFQTLESTTNAYGIFLQCDSNISYLTINGNVFYDMGRAIYVTLGGGTLTYVHTTDNVFSSITASIVSSEVYAGVGSMHRNNMGAVFAIPALDNTGTPTVLNGNKFLTGGTTSITDFDDGVEGQEITIIAEHSLVITDGTNIFTPTGGNLTLQITDTLTLIQKADGKWYTLYYSDNT